MQGTYDMDSTLHIDHRSSNTLTIQAYNDDEIHVVKVIFVFRDLKINPNVLFSTFSILTVP